MSWQRPDIGSRVTREGHARFWERPGVKFPRATRQLWAVLCDEKWDVHRHDLEVVSIANHGESWLFRFPDKFVDLIARLDDSAIERVAAAWSNNGEVPGDGSDNEPVLLDLKRLASSAQTKNRGLYLWGSL
jgi:hypothetical protein